MKDTGRIIVCIIAMICYASTVFSQHVMRITKTDGSIIDIPVNTVSDISFIDNSVCNTDPEAEYDMDLISGSIVGKWKCVDLIFKNYWEEFPGAEKQDYSDIIGRMMWLKSDGTYVDLPSKDSGGKWRISKDHLILYDCYDYSESDSTVILDAEFLVEKLTNKTMVLYLNQYFLSITMTLERVE